MKTFTIIVPSADFDLDKIRDFLNGNYYDNYVIYFPEKNLHPRNIIKKCIEITHTFLGSYKSMVLFTFSPYVVKYFNFCQYRGYIEKANKAYAETQNAPKEIIAIVPECLNFLEVQADFSTKSLKYEPNKEVINFDPLDDVFEDLYNWFEVLYKIDGDILRMKDSKNVFLK